MRADPRQSVPAGAELTLGTETAAGAVHARRDPRLHNSPSRRPPRSDRRLPYAFSSWSDGGARTHDVTANAAADVHGRPSRRRVGVEARRRRRGRHATSARPPPAGPRSTARWPSVGRHARPRCACAWTRPRRRPQSCIGLYARQRRPADDAARPAGGSARPQAGAWNRGAGLRPEPHGRTRRTGSACSTRPTAPACCAGTTARAARGGAEQTSASQTPGDAARHLGDAARPGATGRSRATCWGPERPPATAGRSP